MTVKIIETTIVDYTYDVDENGQKIVDSKVLSNSDVFEVVHIYADDGKVFRRISTNEVLTNHIGIGSNDSIDDFEEIFIS